MNTDYVTKHSDCLKSFLQYELIKRCKNNPKYSLRSFARFLKIDASTLSKILSGKRKLGKRLSSKIIERLGLDPKQAELLSDTNKVDSVDEDHFRQLTLDHFQLMSNWYYYAILELIQVDDFKYNLKWIASSLGISEAEVSMAVQILERLGLVYVKDGIFKLHSNSSCTTINNQFTSTAFRKLQKDILLKAIDALENTPFNQRDQSSMTMAIDSSKIPEAKIMIKNFRRQLCHFLENGEQKDRVYNLGISLYPINKEHTGE